MIQITRSDFNKLKEKYPDYIGQALTDYTHNGKTCKKGDYTAFSGILTNETITTSLLFQNIHFEII